MLRKLLLASVLATLAGSVLADSIANTASEKISVGAVSVVVAPQPVSPLVPPGAGNLPWGRCWR
jgi:sorbitol-specific phosphotransferase system component IIBC